MASESLDEESESESSAALFRALAAFFSEFRLVVVLEPPLIPSPDSDPDPDPDLEEASEALSGAGGGAGSSLRLASKGFWKRR